MGATRATRAHSRGPHEGGKSYARCGAKIGFLPTPSGVNPFQLESNNSEGRFEQYSARAIQRAHQKLQKVKCRKVDHLTPPHANFSRPKP